MSRKNIKRIIILVVVIIAISLIKMYIGDAPLAPTKKSVKDNLNITLFLDLSDHLDHTMSSGNEVCFGFKRHENFIKFSKIFGDIYIQTILDSKRPARTYDEKIHLHTHPVADFPNVNQYLTDINITKNNLQEYVLDNNLFISSTLKNNVAAIFADCGEKYNGKTGKKSYPGSNIFNYFKEKDFYKRDNKNLLIIYTDGYPYHRKNHENEEFRPTKPKWKTNLHDKDESELWSLYEQDSTIGLKPATEDLNNLRVLIIGAETKGTNQYEVELLEFLWTSWLHKMGVQKHNVKLLTMKQCATLKLEKEFNWLLTAPWPGISD